MQENLTVTPDDGVSSFEVDGGRLLVPGFGRLGERLFHAAVAGGADDPTITAYLDSVLDFAAGDGPRLEDLGLRRQATGVYPTTEDEIPETHGPSRGHLFLREEGLRLVLWACGGLEGQIPPP